MRCLNARYSAAGLSSANDRFPASPPLFRPLPPPPIPEVASRHLPGAAVVGEPWQHLRDAWHQAAMLIEDHLSTREERWRSASRWAEDSARASASEAQNGVLEVPVLARRGLQPSSLSRLSCALPNAVYHDVMQARSVVSHNFPVLFQFFPSLLQSQKIPLFRNAPRVWRLTYGKSRAALDSSWAGPAIGTLMAAAYPNTFEMRRSHSVLG